MDRYLLAGMLGDGSFGRVMKATLKENGDVVAIKHIKRKFKTWKACVRLREVQSLRMISHPNIVSIKEVIRESDESLYFVFEYMPDGSLYELMKTCTNTQSLTNFPSGGEAKEKLTDEKIASFTRQILSGLSYIHTRGYFHRDIKPENILVKGNICKVADFGLAREFHSLPPYTYYVSTRWYRAPEVILRTPHYGPPIDLFATGLILAELYSLRPLFPGASEMDQLNLMMNVLGPPTEKTWKEGLQLWRRMNLRLAPTSSSTDDDNKENDDKILADLKRRMPHGSSPVAPDLIYALIQWNPSSRLDCSQALQHVYFRSLDGSHRQKAESPRYSSKSSRKNVFDGKPNSLSITKAANAKHASLDSTHAPRQVSQQLLQKTGADASDAPRFLSAQKKPGPAKASSTNLAAPSEKPFRVEEDNEFCQYLERRDNITQSYGTNEGAINRLGPILGCTWGLSNRPAEIPQRHGRILSDTALPHISVTTPRTTRRDCIARATNLIDNKKPSKRAGSQQRSHSKRCGPRSSRAIRRAVVVEIHTVSRDSDLANVQTVDANSKLRDSQVENADDDVWRPFDV